MLMLSIVPFPLPTIFSKLNKYNCSAFTYLLESAAVSFNKVQLPSIFIIYKFSSFSFNKIGEIVVAELSITFQPIVSVKSSQL